nr:MAG TPA: hypothetical protein [Caudoviricetes sp.]
MMYLDINEFACALLQKIYTAETYEEINYLFDVYSSTLFPRDWDAILSCALWEQRIYINQVWFVQRLREAGGL